MSAANIGAGDTEFKLVVPRKGKHRSKLGGKLKASFNTPQARLVVPRSVEVCQDTVIKQLQAAESELRQSAFFEECFDNIYPTLANVEQIVCLGLGNFSECAIARYQLAFIRCLREKANLCSGGQFYDPVFSSSEVKILCALGETVLSENLEGKYSVECKTLFYLPHCPKQIVNNVLWKNWDRAHLINVILLCNSFSAVVNNHPQRLLGSSAGYILRASGAFQEVPLSNTFRFTDIFNDTSLHYLPDIGRIEEGAWEHADEPSYDADDLELITKEFTEVLTLGLANHHGNHGYQTGKQQSNAEASTQ